jgi:hypothetical protein
VDYLENKLGEILLENKVIKLLTSDYNLLRKLRQRKDYIFGKLAKDLRIGVLQGDKLVLETTNYLWINEIEFYKEMILKKVNEVIGEEKRKVRLLKIKYQKKEESKSKKNIKEANKTITLEQKILLANYQKRKDGNRLCNVCKAVYCKENVCPFCSSGYC